jgi:hypothetical protein
MAGDFIPHQDGAFDTTRLYIHSLLMKRTGARRYTFVSVGIFDEVPYLTSISPRTQGGGQGKGLFGLLLRQAWAV